MLLDNCLKNGLAREIWDGTGTWFENRKKNVSVTISKLQIHRNELYTLFAASLSWFMIFPQVAWTSPAIPGMMFDPYIQLEPHETFWIVAIHLCGALLGPFVTGFLARQIGPRSLLMSCVIPVIINWVTIGYSRSVVLIYVARALAGIMYGTVMSLSPIYLNETLPESIKEFSDPFLILFGNLSILATFLIGSFVDFRTLTWIMIAFPTMFFIFFMWAPESPHYLIFKNKDNAARTSLQWLRRKQDVSEEISSIKISMEERLQLDHVVKFKKLWEPTVRNGLYILLIFVLAENFTGMFVITSYTNLILVNVSSSLTLGQMSTGLALVRIIAAIVSKVPKKHFGHRSMLLFSTAGAAIGLFMCSTYFTVDTQAQDDSSGWIAFLGLIAYMILFNFGIDSLPSTIIGEIFTPNLHVFVNGIFAIMNYLMSIGLSKMFQSTLFIKGAHVPFWIFTISATVCALLIYKFVPETKNLSIEDARQAVAEKFKIKGPSYACFKALNPCKTCSEDSNN